MTVFPWQIEQWQALQERVRAGRLPHGLLLHGPAGTGKKEFANQFAQSLLCRTPDAGGNPCGTCQACHLVAAGTHPDLQQISPEEDRKVIRVDQIRTLSARLAAKSQFGGYRVAVITPAERMNIEAANSLLKTLEEPGADTVLLLVSAQPGRLPPTVRSRCQRLAFPLPDRGVAEGWLAQFGSDPVALLAVANGAPLAGRRLAEEGGLEQRAALFADLAALVRDREDPIQLAGKWHGLDMANGLAWIGGWTCDLIRLQAAAEPPRLENVDRTAELEAIARCIPRRTLFAQLDRLGEARRLLHTAVSPQAILESVFVPLKNTDAGR